MTGTQFQVRLIPLPQQMEQHHPRKVSIKAFVLPRSYTRNWYLRKSNPPFPNLTESSGRKQNVDMEKLAEGLQRLTEDDLLHVVQMVQDGKS